MTTYECFFDASHTRERTRCAFFVRHENGHLAGKQVVETKERAKNSVEAESQALLLLLNWIKHKIEVGSKINIYGDALVVINNVNRRKKYRGIFKQIKNDYDVTLEYIPRRKNHLADKLSKGKKAKFPVVPIKATSPKSKAKYVKIESKSMLLEDIKVSENFTPPNPKKYQQRLAFYKENGFTKSSIDIDENCVLIDGYISYLILKENNVQNCNVNVVRRESKEDSFMNNLEFSVMSIERVGEVSALMHRVFLEYNAEDLTEESIEIFKDLTSVEKFSEWLGWRDKLTEFYDMWICEDVNSGEIVGALSAYYDKLDNLFVDSRYHRKGIAQKLFKMLLETFNPAEVLVYSSLYAQDFYRKLGFVGDEEQVINKGQRVIKMTYRHEGGEYSEYVKFYDLIEKLAEKYGAEKATAMFSEASTTVLLNNTDLTNIPGIGKKMARHLINAGYPNIKSLKGQNPDVIYNDDCLFQGTQVDRCALYCYRLAVAYADNDGELPPDKQKWWNWKD